MNAIEPIPIVLVNPPACMGMDFKIKSQLPVDGQAWVVKNLNKNYIKDYDSLVEK